jgi:hypothetical protein
MCLLMVPNAVMSAIVMKCVLDSMRALGWTFMYVGRLQLLVPACHEEIFFLHHSSSPAPAFFRCVFQLLSSDQGNQPLEKMS